MEMGVQGSGNLQSSPLHMPDPSSLDLLTLSPQKSIEREAERAFGRLEHLTNASDTQIPRGWTMSPMPVRMDEESPAQESARVDPSDWYPHYTACLQHFLDNAQHSLPVQAMAAYINIRLPFQRPSNPIVHFSSQPVVDPSTGRELLMATPSCFVSLRVYIRRLIVMAQDTPAVLHAFFGNDWVYGVEFLWKQERLNYLFAAKSDGWASTKDTYDILPHEEAPAVHPLRDPTEEELSTADARWSEWLAMEDWMIGPRSPW